MWGLSTVRILVRALLLLFRYSRCLISLSLHFAFPFPSRPGEAIPSRVPSDLCILFNLLHRFSWFQSLISMCLLNWCWISCCPCWFWLFFWSIFELYNPRSPHAEGSSGSASSSPVTGLAVVSLRAERLPWPASCRQIRSLQVPTMEARRCRFVVRFWPFLFFFFSLLVFFISRLILFVLLLAASCPRRPLQPSPSSSALVHFPLLTKVTSGPWWFFFACRFISSTAHGDSQIYLGSFPVDLHRW